MESEELEIRAVISDDITLNSELIISWSVIQGTDVIMQLDGEWNNITDLSAGIYILKLEVTDGQGKVGLDTLSFEVTLLDSDGDWGPFCDSETWFDDINSIPGYFAAISSRKPSSRFVVLADPSAYRSKITFPLPPHTSPSRRAPNRPPSPSSVACSVSSLRTT